MEEMFIYTWLPGFKNTSAYKMLMAYSRTPYGAMMIKNILLDHKKIIKGREPFKVKQFNEREAGGFTHFIRFPDGFPLKAELVTGDKVDPLAIIHHEFGHTRYFPGHKPNGIGTLEDERNVVIHMENPARLFNNNEPRYAYFNNEEKPKDQRTINIITGEIKAGIWAFDKADPRKLVKPK